jgi:hypothetical protein
MKKPGSYARARRWWHIYILGLSRAAADDLADGIDLGDHDCGFSALPRIEPPAPTPKPPGWTRPPTGDYLETATLRAVEALELVAAAYDKRGDKYPALRLLNLARQAEELAAEQCARRRAETEAAGVGETP